MSLEWLRQEVPDSAVLYYYKNLFEELKLHTVCKEARCPNVVSCFRDRSVTFMILGNMCTRGCSFCAVKRMGKDILAIDNSEPLRIAQAVSMLRLDYVVITSVTRDDIIDGGAEIFARTIKEIKNLKMDLKIEVLIPDFKGMISSLEAVVFAGPDCLTHNIETVERLYRAIRPQADYKRSLKVLREAKGRDLCMVTKSGLMLGLGETHEEILEVMRDLFEVGCDILTLGQYLSPSHENYPVKEFIHPERFKMYEGLALKIGFKAVASSPLVRSSYRAKELYRQLFSGSTKGLQEIGQSVGQLAS